MRTARPYGGSTVVNGQIQYGEALGLTPAATAGSVDVAMRVGRFRHELQLLRNPPTRADLYRMLEMAHELLLPEEMISDELAEIRASLDGFDLADEIARHGPPVVASVRALPADESCHFATPVRFGRRRSDQIGHLELTSGWLKFHGALDISIVWAEVATLERSRRDIVVSIRGRRRVLRFCCHAIGEAVRGAAVGKYLLNAARMKDALAGTLSAPL